MSSLFSSSAPPHGGGFFGKIKAWFAKTFYRRYHHNNNNNNNNETATDSFGQAAHDSVRVIPRSAAEESSHFGGKGRTVGKRGWRDRLPGGLGRAFGGSRSGGAEGGVGGGH